MKKEERKTHRRDASPVLEHQAAPQVMPEKRHKFASEGSTAAFSYPCSSFKEMLTICGN
jgi:hypothetical protein